MIQLNNFLDRIQEGMLFSDKTLAFDLDKFIKSKDGKLIIIGAAGSGKSTIGKKIANKYKVKYFEGDYCWEAAEKKYPDFNNDEKEYSKMNDMYYKCLVKKLQSPGKLVVEGIGFLEIYNGSKEEKEFILNYPVIILGTSMLKSSLRAYKRAKQFKRANKDTLSPVAQLLYYGFINFMGIIDTIKLFKKDRQKVPGTKFEEFNL